MPTLFPTDLPLVAAPMAGGPSTTALVDAAGAAGAFGFLAGGYKTPAELAEEISTVRAQGRSFGVNLFVPQHDPVDLGSFRAYADALGADAAAYGLTLDKVPITDDDHWRDKLDLLLSDPVPVVSLTFGLPGRADIAALRRTGSRVLASITTPHEARLAEAAGVDGLVVQGPRAGGHSATFDPTRAIGSETTATVVARVRAATSLPLVAAGGVEGPATVRELLTAGAEAVAVGTLLLLSAEAGTSTAHRDALVDPEFTETVITRAFTGRPARGLRNDFIDRHDDHAPVGYPAVHHLTRALRQAAARAHDLQRVHLWAGTGHRHARADSAAIILGDLSRGL